MEITQEFQEACALRYSVLCESLRDELKSENTNYSSRQTGAGSYDPNDTPCTEQQLREMHAVDAVTDLAEERGIELTETQIAELAAKIV